MSKRTALRFGRGEEASALTHRDVIALLTDALRRSGLPLALTEGADRRPRFSLAGTLPVGYTSEAEWLELVLVQFVPAEEVVKAVGDALPAGFRVLEAMRLRPGSPSLPSQLRWAEYSIGFGANVPRLEVERAIGAFMARQSYPWEEVIEGKTKRFDLCALTDDLWVRDEGDRVALGMRLDASSNGSGRPDSVLKGLALAEPVARHRTRMIFAYLPQGILLWRRAGRFENTRPER